MIARGRSLRLISEAAIAKWRLEPVLGAAALAIAVCGLPRHGVRQLHDPATALIVPAALGLAFCRGRQCIARISALLIAVIALPSLTGKLPFTSTGAASAFGRLRLPAS
jgi:hypothetical protein